MDFAGNFSKSYIPHFPVHADSILVRCAYKKIHEPCVLSFAGTFQRFGQSSCNPLPSVCLGDGQGSDMSVPRQISVAHDFQDIWIFLDFAHDCRK